MIGYIPLGKNNSRSQILVLSNGRGKYFLADIHKVSAMVGSWRSYLCLSNILFIIMVGIREEIILYSIFWILLPLDILRTINNNILVIYRHRHIQSNRCKSTDTQKTTSARHRYCSHLLKTTTNFYYIR